MYIVKIGGGRDINIDGIISDLAELTVPFIVVHGANALRDEIANRLGKERKLIRSVSGYQSVYSDEDALDVMMMAYAGLRNKRLVEKFQLKGVNAIGLSGLDGALIRGRRNKGIRSKQGEKTIIVRDFSGKPKEANTDLLTMLLNQGYVPVLCPPIVDEEGFAINTENDDIVGLLGELLQPERIFQFIEAPGFLENPEDPTSLVAQLHSSELEEREASTEGRMKRKMLALRRLCEGGGRTVHISDGRVSHPVQAALAGAGTVIQ